ncbi:hypothetical protein EUTSA_v10023803mg [Eutrema salsugineum]|uniref:HMA domain-containing protein n=2 Tax=Eutrema salsugineum TaxID=72664 RepID=V4MCP7_EUTSA|nr:hypothetical protein EUTSA_v10023803mg [Eutrema salsugineum]
MDSKDGKLTVIGEFDIRKILTKLESRWRNAKMATFGPYDPKKEAETAAAAEKKKKEESERKEVEAYRGNQSLCGPPPMYHHVSVYDHDNNSHGCIIS